MKTPSPLAIWSRRARTLKKLGLGRDAMLGGFSKNPAASSMVMVVSIFMEVLLPPGYYE